MNLEGPEDSGGAGGLLALSPGDLAPPHLSLGRGEATVVTLQEGAPGEPLLLCPVEEGRTGSGAPLSTDGAITYATLDAGANFVLQAGEVVKGGGAREGQLVVVGEAGAGEPITYIYIQGEAEAGAEEEVEGDEAKAGPVGHTITLNAADGSALHTLPPPYTPHTYPDLVLLPAPPTPDQSGSGDTQEVGTGQAEKQVLLLSVGPLKVEDDPSPGPAPDPDHSSSPSSSQDKAVTGAAGLAASPVKVVRMRRGTQQQDSRKGGEEDKEGEGGEEVEEDEAEDCGGGSSFEARLATRDSLMPPRRERRSAPAGGLSCPACEVRFKSSRQYHRHLQSHGSGPEAWRCPLCRQPCQSAAALRAHRLGTHEAARPLACPGPGCPLTFSKSLVLEDHVRAVHNKERPLVCSLCPKAFYRPYDLKMHLNLHLGIKTKVCDVCGRQFSHSSNLIRHQCLHTGAKPYVCNTCGKRFKQVTLLHKHRITHQEGSCPLCPASVSTAAALRHHYRQHHKKSLTLREAGRVLRGQRGAAPRSFYCRVCGAMFSVKAALVAHEALQHPQDAHHHCASCRRVVPMAEVKTHACLTPEETRSPSVLLHLRATTTTTTTTTTTMTATTTTAATDTATAVAALSLPQPQPQRVCKGEEETQEEEEEEEEYLVMYITPEGESVSYVMKRGSRGTLDQVLQINAPDEPAPPPPRPEDTIMINVPPQDPEQTHPLLLTPGEEAHPTASPHSLHTIKLEPQGEDEEPLDLLSPPGEPLMPQPTPAILKTEDEKQTPPIKAETEENEEEEEEERGDNGLWEKRNENTKPGGGGGGGRGGKGGGGGGKKKGWLVCGDCGKKFTKQWNFQQHMATHDASLHRYKCEECGQTFAYRSTLNKHRQHHDPSPPIHQCQQCPKTYKCLGSLRQHNRRDHEHWRPYACDLCSKEFFSKSDYKYHMRVHKRELPYMCFTCGQKFSHVSHLHRHERVHTGERPHKCPMCLKTFIQHGTLRTHLKKHQKQDHNNTTTTNTTTTTAVTVTTTTTSTTATTSTTTSAFSDTPNLPLKLRISDESAAMSEATPDDLLDIHGGGIPLPQGSSDVGPPLGHDSLPGGMILSGGSQGGAASFPGVVAGVDGECIAIFVEDELS